MGSLSSREYFEAILYRRALSDLRSRDIGTVADVGCGAGSFIRYLGKQGVRSIGLDFSHNLLRLGKGSQDILCADINHLPIRDARLEALTAFGVFEYFEDIQSPLAEVRRVLGNHGLFVFTLRNRAYFLVWVSRLFDKFEPRYHSLGSILQACASQGFCVRATSSVFAFPFLSYVIPSFGRGPAMKVLVKIESILQKLLPTRLMSLYLVCAFD